MSYKKAVFGNASTASSRSSAPAAAAASFKGSLLLLQNKTKRDPESYTEEFRAQLRHFDALSKIMTTTQRLTGGRVGGDAATAAAAAASGGAAAAPSSLGSGGGGSQLSNAQEDAQFANVLLYLCHVSHCYPKECAHIPDVLLSALKTSGAKMNPATRRTFVQCLILLRSKNLVSPDKTLPVFFDLLLIRDKLLRKTVLSHIVGDIRKFNAPTSKVGTSASSKKHRRGRGGRGGGDSGGADGTGTQNQHQKITKGEALQFNKVVQGFLFSVVQQDDPTQTRCALLVMLDLYRRDIWANEKCVEVVAQACFSKHTRIIRTALRFFLMQFPKISSSNLDGNSDSDVEDDKAITENMTRAMHKYKSKGKTRKRDRLLKKKIKQSKRKLDPELKASKAFARQDIDPVRLLRDPQTFAERLLAQLQKTSERFEIRLLFLTVISRIVAEHQVVMLSLYSYLERFLQPSQIQAPTILALVSTCVHPLIPPDALEPLVKAIANHFVNDRSQPDAITIGLNSIREICKRQPLAMSEDLLRDLVEYRTMRGERGVIMAARSLIQLFRVADPGLLPPKLRAGHDTSEASRPKFGAQQALIDIPGMEKLYGIEEEQNLDGMEVEEGSSGDDEDEESSSSSGSDAASSSGSSSSMIDIPLSDDDDGGDMGEWELDDEDDEENFESDTEKEDNDDDDDVVESDDDDDDANEEDDEEMFDEEDLDDFLSDEEDEEGEDDDDDELQQQQQRKKASSANNRYLKDKRSRVEDDDDMWDEEEPDDGDKDTLNKTTKQPQQEQRGGKKHRAEENNTAAAAPPSAVTNKKRLQAFNNAKRQSESPPQLIRDEDAAPPQQQQKLSSSALAVVSSSSESAGWVEDTAPTKASKKQLKRAGSTATSTDNNTQSGGVGVGSSIASSRVSQMRFLTEDDFEKLRKIQEGADPNEWRSARGRKKAIQELRRKKADLYQSGQAAVGEVTSTAIEGFTNKKRTQDKEDKIAAAVELRKQRSPFNVHKKNKSGAAHATHTEKAKHGKLFQMTKRSGRVGKKLKMSVKERHDRSKDMKKKNTKFRIARGWKA